MGVRWSSLLLAPLVALTVAGCGADASAVYADSAVKVLEGALSETRTAELAAGLWVDGRGTHALAVVAVDESDAGMDSEAAWFQAQQPPTDGSDDVRERTVAALDAASAAVQDLRIAVRRSDEAGVRSALTDLGAASSGLEALAEALG